MDGHESTTNKDWLSSNSQREEVTWDDVAEEHFEV
jgi:hypothetical protein